MATSRRRRTGAEAIPAGVASWFAGAAPVDAAGWHALLPDELPQLLAWWRAFKTANPRATPPTDAGWIDWAAA